MYEFHNCNSTRAYLNQCLGTIIMAGFSYDRPSSVGRRPVEIHSGAQETILAGPYHMNLIPYVPRLRNQRRRGGRKQGEGCLVSTRLHVGVWGAS